MHEVDKDQIIKNFIEDLPHEISNDETKEPEIAVFKKENFVFFKEDDISNDYEITEVWGKGSFGTVLKGIHKTNNQERALKLIPRSKITRKIERFINEVNTLK